MKIMPLCVAGSVEDGTNGKRKAKTTLTTLVVLMKPEISERTLKEPATSPGLLI